MAVVIPFIAAYGAVSAGVTALATAATFGAALAGFASVAGGMLVAAGALTHDRDAMRIGGILSLSGWAAGAAGVGGAVEAGLPEQLSGPVDAPTAAAQIAEAPEQVPNAAMPKQLSGPGAEAAQPLNAAPLDVPAPNAPELQARPVSSPEPGKLSLAEQAAKATGTPANPAAAGVPKLSPSEAAVSQQAKTLTMGDLTWWWDKAKAAGKWAEANPNLLKLGGTVLEGMYGPQAQRLNREVGLADRARASLNRPVRIEYGGPK